MQDHRIARAVDHRGQWERAHLYWILSEPYLIDDVGDPPPVFTDFTDQGEGKKKKPRKYLKGADGEKVYIDGQDKHNAPSLSPKAQHIQDILAGMASKIGGDHTTDLSRLLRVPGTLNRKDQRNGREPVPCTLVECDPNRRYSIDEFAKYAEASPDRVRRETIAKVKLPSLRKLSRNETRPVPRVAVDMRHHRSRQPVRGGLCPVLLGRRTRHDTRLGLGRSAERRQV